MVCKLSGVRACALTRCAHRTFGFTTRWFKLQVSRLHCYLYQSKLLYCNGCLSPSSLQGAHTGRREHVWTRDDLTCLAGQCAPLL